MLLALFGTFLGYKIANEWVNIHIKEKKFIVDWIKIDKIKVFVEYQKTEYQESKNVETRIFYNE